MPLKIFLSSTLRKYLPNYNPTEGIDFSVDEEITVADMELLGPIGFFWGW